MSPPANPADPASPLQDPTLHHLAISTHSDEPGVLQTRDDRAALPASGDRLLLPNEAIQRPWHILGFQLLRWPISSILFSLWHRQRARCLPPTLCASICRAYDRLEERRNTHDSCPLETLEEYITEQNSGTPLGPIVTPSYIRRQLYSLLTHLSNPPSATLLLSMS
ncbi:hypothetical protein K488DRAFT_74669 [Vararia minispora EC-137]|uniref:Uncharacterized protein n=1 Tax=Vararia minispora EC-137 TaxID=1314806 RepID=A0ACB8Q681_9AGAM|nr:hypothetical protein K488DRAFT_74669 [Vararia minispora EC-137]